MVLDIRGSLKNTKLSQNIYVFVEELLANAIDSFLIRSHENTLVSDLDVRFTIRFIERDLVGDELDLILSCTDNGFGFGDQQTKAFVTKDTSYKDDLKIEGIGQCKGLGRIQFLHHFEEMSIESVFEKEGERHRRTLSHGNDAKEISIDSFETDNSSSPVYTTISLKRLRDDIYNKRFNNRDLEEIFSAKSLKRHIIVSTLQRFVSLKEKLGDFTIGIATQKEVHYRDDLEAVEKITKEDLPDHEAIKSVKVLLRDRQGNKTDKETEFRITQFKLDEKEFSLSKNIISLCAQSSIVQDITKRYLKTGAIENNPVSGYYHLIFIES
ncbi:MAG: hypothetical protein AAF603_08625, partial [Pseudomonadota bacterium]